MNLNKPYRKRSWSIALVLHLLILGIVLIAYFSYRSTGHKEIKISINKEHVITANLLSVQQSQALAASEKHLVKQSRSKLKQKLINSNNGKHKLAETKQDNDLNQTKKQIKKITTAKPKSVSHQSNQQEHIASQQQVEQYLASLTTHLYTTIQQKTQINQKIKGNLYATLQVNGTLDDVKVELSPKNKILQKQLKYILSEYHGSKITLKITKSIRINIPIVFN